MAFQETPNINDNEDLSAHHDQVLQSVHVLLARWGLRMSEADLAEFNNIIEHIERAQTVNHRLRARLAKEYERQRANGRKTHPPTPEEQDYG